MTDKNRRKDSRDPADPQKVPENPETARTRKGGQTPDPRDVGDGHTSTLFRSGDKPDSRDPETDPHPS